MALLTGLSKKSFVFNTHKMGFGDPGSFRRIKGIFLFLERSTRLF